MQLSISEDLTHNLHDVYKISFYMLGLAFVSSTLYADRLGRRWRFYLPERGKVGGNQYINGVLNTKGGQIIEQ